MCKAKRALLVFVAALVLVNFIPAAQSQSIPSLPGLKLIPYPVEMTQNGGTFSASAEMKIFVSDFEPNAFGAEQLRDEIFSATGKTLAIESFEGIESIPNSIIVSKNPSAEALPIGEIEASDEIQNQSYILSVSTDSISIQSSGSDGLFYGVQTVRQLFRCNFDGSGIPCVYVRDWPALEWRGIMDDVTRGPCPLLETLKREVRISSYVKMNFITFNQEEQFMFTNHPGISRIGDAENGCITQDEYKELIEYANQHHVSVIGMQQSFGHLRDILAIPEYSHLGENDDVVSPALNETYEFLADLYSDQIDCTDAPFFNVGCDEVAGLGEGAAKDMVAQYGVGGTYARHLKRIRDMVMEKWGKRIMMWGDIILNYPEEMELIPKDTIMLTWSYSPYPAPMFDQQITPFVDAGYDFFVCPGIQCWSRIPPIYEWANINIQNFVLEGVRYGAKGMMNTMWDDDGENLFNLNWHGMLWGAECSWGGSKTTIIDFNSRIGSVLLGESGSHFGNGVTLLTNEIFALIGENQYYWDYSPMINGWTKPEYPVSQEKYAEERAMVAETQAGKYSQIQALSLLGPLSPAITLILDQAVSEFEQAKSDAKFDSDIIDYFIFAAYRLKLTITNEYALDLRDNYIQMKNTYIDLWLNETKPYALSWAINRYNGMIDYYDSLMPENERLPANVLPMAIAAATGSEKSGSPVQFDASGSYDSNGRIIAYSWDFGDGKTAGGKMVSHKYAEPGNYQVVLTVMDDGCEVRSHSFSAAISGSGGLLEKIPGFEVPLIISILAVALAARKTH